MRTRTSHSARRPWLWAGALVLPALSLCALSACASGGSPPPASSAVPAHVGVRPGDAVLIKVWREPDLSDTAQVNADGRLVLPLLGERQVAGMSPDSLRKELEHDYRKYLENPSIEVKVLRRIAILGQVKSPGLYPVDATVTLSDALAMAGGVTSNGNRNDIELIRDGTVVRQSVDRAAVVGSLDIRSGDQILVGQRSWVSRNIGIVGTLIGAATSITVALLIRG